jgi:sugar phosphate isomerase/epimerase
MTASNTLQIGFNARLFPNNWRPALHEIQFGATNSFAALQFPGKEEGLAAEHLGDDIKAVRQALNQAGIAAVMEILMRVDARGYAEAGHTPLEVFAANLPAIDNLKCRCVHIHFVPLPTVTAAQLPALEMILLSTLDVAAGFGKEWGFRFGLEHNERSIGLFSTPQSCAKVLTIVRQLAFVWDINHTHPDDYEGFAALLPRVSMLHVADTRLPETNEHLPLGLGTVDFSHFRQTLRAGDFQGPAILEIGGLLKSGGYGRDTDAALIDSLRRLREAE